jgi:hypothetical protein
LQNNEVFAGQIPENMKTNKLVVVFLTLSQLVYAQLLPKIGFEAGISLSKSADEENRYQYYSEFSTSNVTSEFSFDNKPTPGFLAGVSAEWKLRNNINLSSGLLFQNVNTKYNIRGSQTSTLGIWDFEEWGEEKLYKLSVPVTAGYIFSPGKLKPSVNIGARFNYFLNGRINQKYNNSYFSYYDNSSTNWEDEGEIDPFGPKSDYFIPAKKFIGQLIFRLSTDIGQYFSINLIYNIGLNNSCESIYVHRGNYSTSYTSEYHRISNSDITVSISYYILRPTSHNSKPK